MAYKAIAFAMIVAACCVSEIDSARKVHTIHWESRNPIFRLDNTDHIIDVNQGNVPFEYDQVNIVCPSFDESSPSKSAEQHIIYSVSKEEYETCRITNPKPRIIAVCDRPDRLLYFTITFRSFTPQPGGLEFRPGQDYYFISTSSKEDLHRRVGGHCKSHNMKVTFKVCCKDENKNQDDLEDSNSVDFVPNQRNKTSTVSTVIVDTNESQASENVEAPRVPSFASYQPARPVEVEPSSADDRQDADREAPAFVGFRPYRPEGQERRPAVWRPRWSVTSLESADDAAVEPSTRRPSWFPTSTSRSTSYKNFGFPVFSVKSRPPPKQTDYLYKLEKDLLRRQELLRSSSPRLQSTSTLLMTLSVIVASWLRFYAS